MLRTHSRHVSRTNTSYTHHTTTHCAFPPHADNGLLTTKVQSRGEAGELTTSLDGLRGGDAGERITRDSVAAASLFTNDFLP